MQKYFFDSCIFIENSKNNPKALLLIDKISSLEAEIVINPIVIDEVTFILLKYSNKAIEEIEKELFSIDILPLTIDVCKLTFSVIKKYNLKMHDAFILATCIFFKIQNLVSLDSHFIEPCKSENINLIN